MSDRTVKWMAVGGLALDLVIFSILGLMYFSPIMPTPPSPPPDIAWVKTDFSVDVGVPVDLEVRTKANKVRYIWPAGGYSVELADKKAKFWSVKPGVYTIYTYAALAKDNATAAVQATVTVGTPKPPGPDPKPPDPLPPPTPAPIRVLMIYDASVEATKGQKQAMNAKAVEDYLDSHCRKGADGKTPEWRVWEKNAVPKSGSAEMLAAFDACKMKPMPFVVVSNGKDHAETPIPGDASAEWMLNLLQKYGGK